jgi:hypothetical protein
MRALAIVIVIGCKGASAPPPPPTTPEPVKAATCATDDDCIVSCATKGDCCANPYCESVQARSDALAALTYNDAHPCAKADTDKCPQVGSRMPPSYTITPRCKSGACVAEQTPVVAAAPRVIDLAAYDHSCKVAADCTAVEPAVCAVCGCATQPIAAKELPRFKAEAASIACGEPDPGVQCGDCPATKPACRAGSCIARD